MEILLCAVSFLFSRHIVIPHLLHELEQYAMKTVYWRAVPGSVVGRKSILYSVKGQNHNNNEQFVESIVII